jgi:spermidine synthase
MLILGLTILLGAFLLFQVELIIGKCILPWFGGASAVWITCMLFFQVGLLGGYLYGHLLDRSRVRTQSLLHRFLLFVSVLTLVAQFLLWHTPLILDASWKPQAQGNPFVQVLALLGVSVGLPYLVLASTAPLLQTWWRRLYPNRSPYRLYAFSNLGSFLGLVSYPLVVEPFLHLKTQAQVWTWAYVVFALGCGYCSLRVRNAPELAHKTEPSEVAAEREERGHLSFGRLILWLSFAACASAMFLATTNQLCKNVAPVPLLWVLPLALYLLTFILCFESEGRYSRRWFHPLFFTAMFLACFGLASIGVRANLLLQIVVHLFVLFAACMVCHGELARLKPDPRCLTTFYLTVASGGALGGMFVGLVAPYVFRQYWEYEISFFFAALLFFFVLLRDRDSWVYSPRAKSQLTLLAVAALLPASTALAVGYKELITTLPPVVAIGIAILLLYGRQKPVPSRNRNSMILSSCAIVLLMLGITLIRLGKAPPGKIVSVRNFYGALTVDHRNPGDPVHEAYALEHGEIVHGFEFRSPERQSIPTSYFTTDSGVGLALANHSQASAKPQDLRIGIVGLGIGTIAAYGRPGDYVRFYEINPAVVQLASDTRYFHYLERLPGKFDVVLGDARLSLERELEHGSSQNFDLLVVDAFSGDAIPVHLLTKEAFQLYFRHLQNPNGVLAVHVTNSILNLRPIVVAAAQQLGAASIWVHNDEDKWVSSSSDWVLVSRNHETIDSLAAAAKHAEKLQAQENRLWTDDYSNLLRSLPWRM